MWLRDRIPRYVPRQTYKVIGWCRIIVRVTDIVHASASKLVVGFLNKPTAEIRSVCADLLTLCFAAIGGVEIQNLVTAATRDVEGGLHEIVNGLVDRLNAVSER